YYILYYIIVLRQTSQTVVQGLCTTHNSQFLREEATTNHVVVTFYDLFLHRLWSKRCRRLKEAKAKRNLSIILKRKKV
ncbi:MAG: hypothetical protein ACK53Y_17170, partial [bacterium]